MKKGLVVLVLAVMAAGAVFAAPEFRLGVGGGGYFTGDFGGGVKVSGGGRSYSFETPYAGAGGWAFFDLTYAEISMGFFGAFGSWEGSSFTGLGLDLSVLGKFPIELGNKFILFPQLGITYRIFASANLDGESAGDNDDLNALWFKLGVGGDISFTDHLFMRLGLLYGIRTSNKFEDDLISASKRVPGVSAEAILGNGPDFKVAIGYKF